MRKRKYLLAAAICLSVAILIGGCSASSEENGLGSRTEYDNEAAYATFNKVDVGLANDSSEVLQEDIIAGKIIGTPVGDSFVPDLSGEGIELPDYIAFLSERYGDEDIISADVSSGKTDFSSLYSETSANNRDTSTGSSVEENTDSIIIVGKSSDGSEYSSDDTEDSFAVNGGRQYAAGRDGLEEDDYSAKSDTVKTDTVKPVSDWKLSYTKADPLTNLLLNESDDEWIDAIYQDQVINQAGPDVEELIKTKRLVIYVSSSEGDDRNNGLSPDKPKKTLNYYSEAGGVAILLKCGDVFEMDKEYKVGASTIYAYYGEGPRPVMNFCKPVTTEFVRVEGYKNVWCTDLSRTEFFYDDYSASNCNIGQLYIDGDCNWNRLAVGNEECATYDFAEELNRRADDGWAVDWTKSLLYIYSKTNPKNLDISAAISRSGIRLQEVRDVVFTGIEVIGAGNNSCVVSNSKDVVISNCCFRNAGGTVNASSGYRHGISVIISGKCSNIAFRYNVVDGAYSTGVCLSSSNRSDNLSDIKVSCNVFSHVQIGIDVSGDYLTAIPNGMVEISHNLIFNAVDITNTTTPMNVDENDELVAPPDTYLSYKTGYPYEFIASIYLLSYVNPANLKLCDNVFWQTNRYLAILVTFFSEPETSGNLFYSETTQEDARFLKFMSRTDGYVTNSGLNSNDKIVINVTGSKDSNTKFQSARKSLVEQVKYVIGEAGE